MIHCFLGRCPKKQRIYFIGRALVRFTNFKDSEVELYNANVVGVRNLDDVERTTKVIRFSNLIQLIQIVT